MEVASNEPSNIFSQRNQSAINIKKSVMKLIHKRDIVNPKPFKISSPEKLWVRMREKLLKSPSNKTVLEQFTVQRAQSNTRSGTKYNSIMIDHLRPLRSQHEVNKKKDITKIQINREILMFKHEMEEAFFNSTIKI